MICSILVLVENVGKLIQIMVLYLAAEYSFGIVKFWSIYLSIQNFSTTWLFLTSFQFQPYQPYKLITI